MQKCETFEFRKMETLYSSTSSYSRRGKHTGLQKEKGKELGKVENQYANNLTDVCSSAWLMFTLTTEATHPRDSKQGDAKLAVASNLIWPSPGFFGPFLQLSKIASKVRFLNTFASFWAYFSMLRKEAEIFSFFGKEEYEQTFQVKQAKKPDFSRLMVHCGPHSFFSLSLRWQLQRRPNIYGCFYEGCSSSLSRLIFSLLVKSVFRKSILEWMTYWLG